MQNACSDHLISQGYDPILGMETYFAPFAYQNCDQSFKSITRLQCQLLAELSFGQRIVNDWLTVTNWVPPVNDANPYFGLPKIG